MANFHGPLCICLIGTSGRNWLLHFYAESILLFVPEDADGPSAWKHPENNFFSESEHVLCQAYSQTYTAFSKLRAYSLPTESYTFSGIVHIWVLDEQNSIFSCIKAVLWLPESSHNIDHVHADAYWTKTRTATAVMYLIVWGNKLVHYIWAWPT